MASNNINEIQQITPDEIAIDYSKLDLIKQEQDIIYRLFNVSIIFGNAVRPIKTASINQMTQWLTLIGNEKDRLDAKEYITALCNPECSCDKFLQKNLLNNIEFVKFKEDIIKNYKLVVNFVGQFYNSKDKIELKGSALNLTTVYSLLDKKLEFYKIDNNLNVDNNNVVDGDDDDDDDDEDVICMDDPYEQLDRPTKSQSKSSSINESNLLNRFNEKLNVSPISLSSLNKIDNNENLIQIGIKKGFSRHEIDNAFKELKDTVKTMNEQQFLKYLEFHNGIKKCSIDSSEYNFKTTSLVENKKTSKIQNEDDDDCKLIDYIPPKQKSLIERNQVLEEYARMFDKQGFDNKFKEFENKEVRMKTLTLAMNDRDQQLDALNKINVLKSKNEINKISSPLNIDQIQQPISNLNQNIEPTLLKNLNYNPKNYVTSSITNESINNDVEFTNFDDDKHNNQHDNNNDDNDDDKNFRPSRRNDIKNNKKIIPNRGHSKNNQELRSKSSNPYSKDRSIKKQNNNNHQLPLSSDETIQINNNLRPIYIDGSNVAREHGKDKGGTFSCKGIKIAVDYFLKRGHKVEAYIPRFRRGNSDIKCPTINPEYLDELDNLGILKYCPSKSYDDNFIIQTAYHHDGVIISNDQYRDIIKDNPQYKDKLRLLEYVFSGDLFMLPNDPNGRNGPKLDEYLSFGKVNQSIPIKRQPRRTKRSFILNKKNFKPFSFNSINR